MPFDLLYEDAPSGRLAPRPGSRGPRARSRRRGACAALSGAAAEDRAAAYYLSRGARIIARNFRAERLYGGGEIDLIVRIDDVLVFVEVKSRRTLEAALTATSPAQWRRLESAALRFMMLEQMGEADCRFDLVAFDRDGCREVLENAHGH